MISDEQIEKTLCWLDDCNKAARNQPDESAGVEKTKIYSKLAVLEVSGWIEESNDHLIMEIADRELPSETAKSRVKAPIQDVKGFQYGKHFTKIIDSSIGSLNRGIIERNMDDAVLENFKNSLDFLSTRRNQLAHTYSRTQKYADEVSITIGHFQHVREGLLAYEEAISRMITALKRLPEKGAIDRP